MSSPGYDVLVLGGGTAGCVLAGRLSEDPECRVCLVEAGPDYGPFAAGGWPPEMVDAHDLPVSHLWLTDRADRWQHRARILGGCSAHNACVALEGAAEDYDEWGPGWTYDELAPYLARARDALRARTPDLDELFPWHRAFLDAGGDDAVLLPVNALGRVRWNAAFAYVDPARDRPNLTIVPDTVVDRVVVERGRARGALTSAGAFEADTVVVAAGAYGSPGILLRSGIGPDAGIPVGKTLRDHVGVGFAYDATPALKREIAACAARNPPFFAQVCVLARSPACPPHLWDLFVYPWLERDWSISAAVVAMKPRSTGTVALNGPGPETPLAIDHGFLSERADAEVLSYGIELLRDVVGREPVAACAARETLPGAHIRAGIYARAGARGFYHPVGTCPIGPVVDPTGAVHGHERLYVADASIMPSIPRSNTNLTVAAIAERIADHLGGRDANDADAAVRAR